ncbi:S8 family peptidase [Agrobacterium vitis]|uniref:S8 family peptidase n=1 Tax=Allorhizobium ampelinum TaxID=3025782 RepID=UPI001F38171B|nr:S8 family peptidase [Allorhizobium ampelinum]MCF1449360.1 S8 family peptidase [Allorhizobium ampelinum]
MANGDDYSVHELAHIRFEPFRVEAQYEFPNRPQDRKPRRDDYHAHAQSLAAQLTAALGALPATGNDQRLAIADQKRGTIVEVETMAPASPKQGATKTPALDYPAQDIVVLRSERQQDRTERSVLFVPDDARNYLLGRINAYGAENLGNRKRPDVPKFEPIETVRTAQARSLFSGTIDFEAPESRWWELWVREPAEQKPGARTNAVIGGAGAAGLDVHNERLSFPDAEVVFVHGSAGQVLSFLERIPGAIWEVRKAEGTIEPFLEVGGTGLVQQDWVADLAGRIEAPPEGAPSVCVLDSGVAAAHPLLAPGMAGAWSIDAAWGTDDHHHHGGHGTPMAGMVLHGDLFWRMNDNQPVQLTHHVESVKFLPPNGFPANRPSAYGIVTQSAIATVEIERPHVARSFCVASSTSLFAPDAPSSWSGALDQISAGSMPGEQDSQILAKDHEKRLLLVASGNVIGGLRAQVEQHHTIEDPAQSWNALTIGGFTAKAGLAPDLTPLAAANDMSPFSTGSQDMLGDLTPIKPEVLFEAGNMMVDQAGYCDWHPAVSLLGTGSDVVGEPLVPFWATSAATGMAGNFVGRLKAALPNLWPETYRTLVVQSAEWPTPIRRKLIGTGAHWKTGSKGDKQRILRDVGFGVPNLSRAIASARNDTTLLAQAEIQPFAVGQGGSAVFNEMHFYELPWPRAALQGLESTVVVMKVTLSYFIEPNLSGRAATRPDTYRSYGLRFELKKRLETDDEFRLRLSRPEDSASDSETGDQPAEKEKQAAEASRWLLGPKAVQAGSLHCDLWRGYAVDLASHDHIAVYPVSGWWKSHTGQRRMTDKGRYTLAISITAEGQDVDLYSEISAEVTARIAAAIEVDAAD